MIEQRFLAETPERLMGDRAYDGDPLDVHIRDRFGVQLVAPHNSRRSQAPTQDRRVLRLYRRRRKIRHLFAWLHDFRPVSFAGNTIQRISSGWCSLPVPSSS
jgi:hypothetical protein